MTDISEPVESFNGCELAKRRLLLARGEPLLLSDWARALFIHFQVDPAALQAEVPFKLDLRDSNAYVSLVAFTMRRMRPRQGGRLAEWCFKPISTHVLLNLRTYVRHRGESGIYFLTEWIPNRLSVFLGPRTFGLPYRLARLEYEHHHETGSLRGQVKSLPQRQNGDELAVGKSLVYTAELGPDEFRPCPANSLDEFLLERYTAFTQQGSKGRFFRVWHPAWPQVRARVSLHQDCLLDGAYMKGATLVGANYSAGVENVWMGRPHSAERPTRRNSVLSAFYEMP